jgi:hypothetical protein
MPPRLVELLLRLKATAAGRFVFPEVYLTFHELPNAAKKSWSLVYKEAMRSGRKRSQARELAWDAVSSQQKPDEPINPNRLTDLVPG